MNTYRRKRCSKIKNLEERLACLRQKYEETTDQLESERSNTASDEGIIEYQHLIEERQLMKKHIDRLAQQLVNEEKLLSNNNKSKTIQPGHTIHLKNSNHSLKFRLVEEPAMSEEVEITTNSPIGRAVLGKRVGDSITVEAPRGKIHYTIKVVK